MGWTAARAPRWAGGLLLAAAAARGALPGTRRWLPQPQPGPLQLLQFSQAAAGPQSRPAEAQRLAAFVGGLAAGGLALAASGAVRRRSAFRDHMHKELLPHCIRRTVTVQCPGVCRGLVAIKVLPEANGAEVSLSRGSARGVPAASWRKAYSFPWREGSYECRQEALVLESGVLTLVFEAERQRQRTLHVQPPAPAMAYSMAGGDIRTPSCGEEPQDGSSEGCDVRSEPLPDEVSELEEDLALAAAGG
mmetsp:Transcript_32219/g.100037  ORF Transcript_32219/g.100037 Transcript_32219/m.100037 type:complete len:248 (+) Transcript_32219:48-791(+)